MAKLSQEFALFVQTATMDNFTTPYFTKSPKSIGISTLPINKAALKLENLLSGYLVNFANTVQSIPQSNLSMLALENDLNATLRLYSQQIYWLGVIYTAAFDEIKPILTNRDLDNIKTIADSTRTSIWNRIDKFFVREKLIADESNAAKLKEILKDGGQPKALKPIFKPKEHEPLNLDKQFSGLATGLSTSALNIGTIDKAMQISEGVAMGQIINPRHVTEDKVASASFLDSFKSFAQKVKRVEFRVKKGLNLTHEAIWIT